jgi:protein-tyrosine phosphatase
MLTEQFGTLRGMVRLGLAYAELGIGLAPVSKPAPSDVRRLVFVCHGNICRSAFAEAVARRQGLRAASFGLSSESGQPAHELVATLARRSGIDLSGHRTTAAPDFVLIEGDLFLAMEVRHLRRLAAEQRFADVPRMLLGSYAPVPIPHLHDPYGLNEGYMKVCLDRIEKAVTRLRQTYSAARAS